jgi:hypothetical protein
MTTPKRSDETDKADALRRMLRTETGRATRKPATNRADNAMVRTPRKPSMPKMPWDEVPSKIGAL